MAETYTANKSLAMVTPGTDPGTWGPFVNLNPALLDNMLGGAATIALTNAPVILSSAQYQCNFINFTGALSGNCAITFPPVGSFYTVQNLTSNTSTFQVTLTTSNPAGQVIGCPWGEAIDIMTDGVNVRFRNLGRVGSYWDHAGSSVPAWVSNCTIQPYLLCDGTTFSSAIYPVLATILGSTTLPDARGRLRLALDAGVGRVSSAVSGVPANTLLGAGGDQSMQQHNHTTVESAHSHGVHGANLSPSIQFGQQSPNTATLWSSANATSFGVTDTTLTNLTIANTGTGGSQNMPPVYVGGITLIRSA